MKAFALFILANFGVAEELVHIYQHAPMYYVVLYGVLMFLLVNGCIFLLKTSGVTPLFFVLLNIGVAVGLFGLYLQAKPIHYIAICGVFSSCS